MTLSLIKDAVYERLESSALTEPLYFPNTNDDRKVQPPTVNHLRPFVLPSETRTIGVRTLDQEVGLIQVSVYIGKGQNDFEGTELAELILALFPRNLDLTVCRIDQSGSIAPSFFDEGWQVTPVSIPYQNLC